MVAVTKWRIDQYIPKIPDHKQLWKSQRVFHNIPKFLNVTKIDFNVPNWYFIVIKPQNI